MLRNKVLRNDVNIIFDPIPKYVRSDFHEKRIRGRQRVAVHSTSDFTAASTIVCHTSAQAP